jgi:hypothetical protein
MKTKHTLAETESSLRKAARAVGLDWGIAEEAGKAARWLAAFELPGAEITLAHLQQLDGKVYQLYKPTHLHEIWQAEGDYLCPIITGAALADRSEQMLSGRQFRLGQIAWPLLLAATIGQAARYHNATFTTSWGRVAVSCYENGIRIDGNLDDLLLASTQSVKCMQSMHSNPQSLPSTMACEIDDKAWEDIDKLAFMTYAPATEESRAGAGAGLTDND